MSTVAVIAATGGCGQHVLPCLLDAGHTVRAVVRTPSKVALQHDRLTVHQADVTDSASIHAALEGVDVVLSCLGNGRSSVQVTHSGTVHILDAMDAHGIERLAVISSVGVGDSVDQPADGLATRFALGMFIRMVVPLFLRATFADLEEMEKAIHARCPKAVVVRPTGLTHQAGKGRYRILGPSEPLGSTIPRADVAHFMARVVDDTQWDGRDVSLCS